MIRRHYTKCLIRPEDVPPSREDMEVIGTFNPGAVEVNGEVVLLVRVAERPKERREGFTPIPRYDPIEGFAIDWFPHDELDRSDPRVVYHHVHERMYLTFVSSCRVARSKDGRTIDRIESHGLFPQADYETFGVEDPRITPIDGRYYLTYVAVSSHGAATALASTRDFENFERHGIVFSPENKDVVLFPERIGGEYWALHRPNPRTHFSSPEMWTGRSPDLVHWGKNRPLHGGRFAWEGGRVGGGVPPFRTDRGWLELYHGNRRGTPDMPIGEYAAGALLLELNDPSRIVGYTPEPLMTPQEEFERIGFVSHVVFPTGYALRGDVLQVYYGASDTFTGVVEFALEDILRELV